MVVSEAFLALNGYVLDATNAEVAVVFLAAAAGELSEDELADWLRTRLLD